MEFRSKIDIRRNRWIAFMLLWLFIGHIGGISLFMHRHTIDGQTIYHSHFYAGSADNPHHNHTLQQCNAITALSLYIALAATASAMFAAMFGNETKIEFLVSQRITQRAQEYYLLRAPPVFI